ncbi:MAG TPA: amino acid deaminase/aldolase [Marmoricola sp.]|nr:amino acid deaminase/aldolase [Marmoricola sp.]
MNAFTSEVERHRLKRRLDRAVSSIPDPGPPLVVVDLDAFDANAADLVRRANGKPIRLASKSIRIPALIQRALDHPGFSGVLSYNLREALWLANQGISDDIVVGYPSVDRLALARLANDDQARQVITLMVDDPAHLELIAELVHGTTSEHPIQICLDVDAGLWLGNNQVGPKRSPVRDQPAVRRLAQQAHDHGFRVVGVMTYEGQVAGVADQIPGQAPKMAIIRKLKSASIQQLLQRRREVLAALKGVAELEFFNAGGSGSLESSSADPAVTEVAAGSGLLVPALFDHYASFQPRPACFFGVPVVRRPNQGIATVAGGGFIASGPAGKDRSPVPWSPPGLQLTGLEGAGEVQTPLTGLAAAQLRIGDLVWFRHAKSGEIAEHTNVVHLLQGDQIVDSVPTYRGNGNAW